MTTWEKGTLRVEIACKIVGHIYTDPNAKIGPATQHQREHGLRIADEIIAMCPKSMAVDGRRPQDWIAMALDGFFEDDGRKMPERMKGALAAKMVLACAGIQGEVDVEPFERLLYVRE